MAEDDKAEQDDKERDATGGFFSAARHRAGSETILGSEGTGARKGKDEPGPPGDVDTGPQVAHEDSDNADDVPDTEAAHELTAAEEAGQVAYGSGDTDDATSPTGSESSSG